MEIRLRSILNRIHWSLALKAVFLSAVWLFLPGWLFLIFSFYFYFVPVFHPWKLFLPLLVFLFLALNGPWNFSFAIILGSLFYIILGIKDLVLIDRRSAYDILVLVLLFLLDIWFFSEFGDSVSYLGLISVFLLSAVLCLLYRGSLSYGNHEWRVRAMGKGNIALGLTWLIISQITLAVLFLPVNFLYQSALIFFLSAVVFGLVSADLGGAITREKILINFSAVSIFLVVILGLAQWGL